jgi:hypothetical protein
MTTIDIVTSRGSVLVYAESKTRLRVRVNELVGRRYVVGMATVGRRSDDLLRLMAALAGVG